MIDGASSLAPYLSLMNDPKCAGPKFQDIPANIANNSSVFTVSKKIPAFRLGVALKENRAAELRWSYGMCLAEEIDRRKRATHDHE